MFENKLKYLVMTKFIIPLILIISILACSEEDCLRASFEVDPCLFSIFPEMEDELILKTNDEDIIEFTTIGQELENMLAYSSDEDCYNHQSLNAYFELGKDNARIRYNMTTYGQGSAPRFTISYNDSLGVFQDPVSIFRRGVYSIHIDEDCTLAERHHVDSTRVNNVLFRDVYRIKEVDDGEPNYGKKPRFLYLYLTEGGEILKFESETGMEVWGKI